MIDSEPGGEEGRDDPRPHAPIRPWPIIAVLAAAAAVVGATTVDIPYYSISPGSALDVAPLVRVADGPSYPARGTIYLTTVSLNRTTLLEALEGWLDPTVDVVKERVIVPPDSSPDDVRQQNLQLMDTSKEQALGVAFEALGYDAITGSGAEIASVVDGSPADGVLHRGDVITGVDDQPVELHGDAVRFLGTHRPGDTVTLTVQPKGGGPEQRPTVTLAAKPEDRRKPLLGVTLATKDPRFDFPFKVDIASEQIGGPSAGLAFTLGVLDLLTEGELTGGRKVAATGTIELDGTVGEVGGVAQKTEAVKQVGVDLFLVPAAEVEQARAHAGKHLQVEAVRNLHDALRILASFGGNGLALEGPARDGA